ncbi:unnamed protein product [Vicia faba]|uniref:Uncharacterized protein n=1 Tax=Vicia faba TaxID=3906 RepID=A0AAV0ZHX6_VICFA|nr:unnamed protein product [Vicia faba]
MSLIGHSSSSCTACCQTVISEYRNRGMEFILEAINYPTYLEDVTGLTELMKSATKFSLETDNEDEFCWLSSSHGTEGPVGDALKCEFKFSPADASPLKSILESDYNMDLKDNIEGLPILDGDKKTSPFDIKLRCEMEVDLDAIPTSLSTFGESDMTSGITDDLMPEQKIQGHQLKQPVQPCIERLKSKNQ